MKINRFDSKTWPVLSQKDPKVARWAQTMASFYKVEPSRMIVRGYTPGTLPDYPTEEAYAFSLKGVGRPFHQFTQDQGGLRL